MSIVLIGFMAVGKTSVGTALTEELKKSDKDYCFIDADKYIEECEKMSVNDIFEKHGEMYFRDKETEALEKMMSDEKIVVATGGGMPVREKNRELIKKIGNVVYLRAKADTIVGRVVADTIRPLLKDKSALYEKVIRMSEERTPIYESIADIIVDVDDRTVKDIVSEIVSKLA